MRKGAFFSLTLLLCCLSFFPFAARADSLIARFVFVTEPQIVRAGERSGPYTVQAQNAVGSSQQSEETIDLAFSSTSATGEFLNETGDPVRTVMNKGTANRTFYYRDSSSGTHTLAVAAVGRISGKSWTASQQITIESAGGATLPAVISPAAGVPQEISPVSPAPSVPGIEARAGSDRTVVAGASAAFEGTAIGLLGIPIENARFLWNFGDGSTVEGRRVSHGFRAPGTYMTGLHVSSGVYAASDYIMVTVVPNKVEIREVTKGDAGFIRLSNGSEEALDIGGWIIEEGETRRFVLPLATMMRGKGDIALPHAVTGLSGATPLRVRFPDGSLAFSYPQDLGVPEKTAAPVAILSAVVVSPPRIADRTHQKADAERATSSSPDEAAISRSHAASARIETPSSGYSFFALAALASAGASAAFLFLKRFIA